MPRRGPRYWDAFKKGDMKMAEQLRTKEQVNQDYGNTCAQIGERMFQIKIMEQDIEALYKRIVAIGEEMKQIDAASKPASAPTPPSEGVANEASQQ